MKRLIILLTVCAGLVFYSAQAQENKDRNIFHAYTQSVDRTLPKGRLLAETALYFTGRPYQAATLEINEVEDLVSNLREFDCTTLVETCLALAQTSYEGDEGFVEFENYLQAIRYRRGIIDGYTSRLHYVTEWITDNERKGFVRDKTQGIGGVILPLKLNFMSAHAELYPALKNNRANIEQMKEIEDIISQYIYYYIPKTDMEASLSQIGTGDILFFTTSADGLDVSHAGIAYWQGDVLTFIHASSSHKQVLVNPEPLTDYLQKNKRMNGVVVVEVL